MNSHTDITQAYQSGSFMERIYLFCEYRDFREEFLEIEQTGAGQSEQAGTSQSWFEKFLSALSLNL